MKFINAIKLLRPSVALGIVFFLAPMLATSQQSLKATHAQEASLKSFLVNYFSDKHSPPDETTRYSASFVDLNGDGQPEVVVYITGDQLCGTGGCNLYILSTQNSVYRVVSHTTITHLPIRVLPTRTNGWSDLSVVVVGGGIREGYHAKLSFNGKRYPRNPTIPPATHLPQKSIGTVLIPASEYGKGKHLYP